NGCETWNLGAKSLRVTASDCRDRTFELLVTVCSGSGASLCGLTKWRRFSSMISRTECPLTKPKRFTAKRSRIAHGDGEGEGQPPMGEVPCVRQGPPGRSAVASRTAKSSPPHPI